MSDDASIGGRISGSRRKKGVLALDDISLELQAGNRLGIIGHNGSGKSTLLKTMAGIFVPEHGRVEIEGSLGTLFSSKIGVKPTASGRENIIFGGLLRGLSRKQAEDKFAEIAEFSELEGYLDLPLTTYSRGMEMRLAFSIATAFEPEILLLDEWLGAGDQSFREKAQARMKQLVDKAGIIVLASHRIPLIKDNCDQCLWLEHGRIRMFGGIDEVIRTFRDEMQSG